MRNNFLKILGAFVVLSITLGVGILIGSTIVAARARTPVSIAPPAIEFESILDTVGEPGVLVASVVDSSPAAEAGVVRGDIIMAVNDQTVEGLQELRTQLDELAAGDEVTLTILHGDEERSLTATLSEGDERPFLGIMPCGVDHPITRQINVGGPADISGTIITGVEPDTPAARAGLQVGEMIFSLDGEPLSMENPLPEVLSNYGPGDEVTLEVGLPGGEKRQVTVILGEHPEKGGSAYLGVRYFNLPGLGGIIGLEALPFHLPPLEDEGQDIPGIPFEREFRFFYDPPFEGERPFRRDIPIPEGDFEQGVLIGEVKEGSAAEDAGLKAGDWILEVNSEAFDSTDSFVNLIQDHQPGDSLTLLVFDPETGENKEVEITLGEHPDKENFGFLGITIGGMFIRSFGDTDEELDQEFFFHHDFDFHPPFEFQFPPDRFHQTPPETPMQEGYQLQVGKGIRLPLTCLYNS